MNISPSMMSRDPVWRTVERVRRRLRGVLLLRSVLTGCACLSGITVLLWHLQVPGLAPDSAGGRVVALAGGLLAAALVARHAQRVFFDSARAALWIEEQQQPAGPSSFALVTWVEQQASRVPTLRDSVSVTDTAGWLYDRANAQLARTDIAGALWRSTRRQLLGPALFASGALALVLVSRSHGIAVVVSAASRPASLVAPEVSRLLPLGVWDVRVTPPSYTGLPARTVGDVHTVRVLGGSVVRVMGDGPLPDSVSGRAVRDDSLAQRTRVAAPMQTMENGRWTLQWVAAEVPMEFRMTRGGRTRLLLLDAYADSVPAVTLDLPARDTVLRVAAGRFPLRASVRDDIGLQSARFELIVSSGEGERFTARTVMVGEQRLNGARSATLSDALDLTAMQLGPGDIVHLRAMARDAHPQSAREYGLSDTRSFRIARAAEYDSVAVEPAPPPEVDKSLLSQRMVLLLTEKLQQRRPRMVRGDVVTESSRLARDQARLRQSVGDVVFQRLSGESSAEHSHFAGDGHEHGVDLAGGKLSLSAKVTDGMVEEGNDSPVIAINQPLLEAYNAMWDAGRELEVGDPAAAIPHMKLALAALERARAASRLYLRGKPPTVIVDVAKIRMAGKDTGVISTRRARDLVPSRDVARDARVVAAAQLVARDAEAARDSIAVLRLEVVADAPALAAALDALLQTMARGGDVTDGFVRARRVLGGVVRTESGVWSRAVPP